MTENAAWLVRSGALIPDQMYILFICEQPPTTGDGISWWGPESNTPTRIIREDLIRRLRPDLLLEPGGGPVKIQPPMDDGTRTQWFDEQAARERERLTRERDALLAAAKRMAECFLPVEPGYVWPGIEMNNIGPAAQGILDAIALCEEK